MEPELLSGCVVGASKIGGDLKATMDVVRVAQATVGEEEWLALRPALERDYYGHAEKVVEFERAIATYLGCVDRPVVCVSSGTAALHLALLALGVCRNDDVYAVSRK